jgi:hypothetical protein
MDIDGLTVTTKLMTMGHSNLSFRVDLSDSTNPEQRIRSLLFKFISPTSPLVMEEAVRIGQALAELGLDTNRLLYFDMNEKYLVEEFIEGVDSDNRVLWQPQVIATTLESLERLHRVPPSVFGLEQTPLDTYASSEHTHPCRAIVQASGMTQEEKEILLAVLDDNEIDFLWSNRPKTQMVTAHGDLGGSNIIYGAENSKVYLIDWEDAGLNFRSWDLLVFLQSKYRWISTDGSSYLRKNPDFDDPTDMDLHLGLYLHFWKVDPERKQSDFKYQLREIPRSFTAPLVSVVPDGKLTERPEVEASSKDIVYSSGEKMDFKSQPFWGYELFQEDLDHFLALARSAIDQFPTEYAALKREFEYCAVAREQYMVCWAIRTSEEPPVPCDYLTRALGHARSYFSKQKKFFGEGI